jgi:hypothetical protein
VEEIRVFAHELPGKVRELIHEGNVRRIIIKDEKGHTFVEIPVTVAAVGAVLAPLLAAVSALAAMAAKFTVVVEKAGEEEQPATAASSASAGEPPAGN